MGRWDTRRSDAANMRVGQLADHDGCGAKACAKPDQTTMVEEEVEWLAKTRFASSASTPRK